MPVQHPSFAGLARSARHVPACCLHHLPEGREQHITLPGLHALSVHLADALVNRLDLLALVRGFDGQGTGQFVLVQLLRQLRHH